MFVIINVGTYLQEIIGYEIYSFVTFLLYKSDGDKDKIYLCSL